MSEIALVSLEDYENDAAKKLPKGPLGFFQTGAGNELTLSLNKSSINRLRIRPRFLRDVSNRNLSSKIFGEKIQFPIGISPASNQILAHPEGELASVRAAEKAGVVFTLSSVSNYSIEEVAAAAPNCIKWFQLYVIKNREYSKAFIRRAEKAGFQAIVMTIDLPVIGLRRADLRNNYYPPAGTRYGNFENSGISYLEHAAQLDASIDWNDLKSLVEFAKIPVLIKGVLTKEDAVLALQHGVKGIIVSNHGGRQLDSTPSTIEALPEIVDAVGGLTTIIVDGGIRQGTDIFKALALGADMAFVGRPMIWGLAVNGQSGVENVINILKNEFDNTMALTGCRQLSDIQKEMVVHENYYCKL